MMVVLTIVFSAVFKNHIENFPLYVLSGRLIYTFFSESTNFAADSIHRNGALIKKIYVPKYFFPISRVISSFITSSVALVPIILVMAFSGVSFSFFNLFIIVPMLLLLITAIGIGLILSTITVFFQDLKHFYSIVLTILMYMTPIFYPAEIIPEKYRFLVELNPIYPLVMMFRGAIMEPHQINLYYLSISIFYALGYLVLGLFLFYKKQDRFIFHL